MNPDTTLQSTKQLTAEPKQIAEIVSSLGLDSEDIDFYGRFKAKFTSECINRLLDTPKKGKLVLMTAMTPTKSGEGKTTVAIGLVQALHRLGEKAIACLRQPSLGPVFGIKGGATGGGLAKLFPSDDINLHFTGDFHAITSANNLLAAMIDNHIFHGNSLDINPESITFRRAMDMNDRSLRRVTIAASSHADGQSTSFDITAASEVMAIVCLSKTLPDLKERLGNIVVARNKKDEPVFARDLEASNAMTALLSDALRPNLAQTIEGVPAIIHGGPFANIAHGCSSIIGTKVGLRLADFVVTEAGFGADLGFEKYCDIVAASEPEELAPDAVVIVATIKALKRQGGVTESLLSEPDEGSIAAGFQNLKKHIDIVKKAGLPLFIAINKHANDSEEELSLTKTLCQQENIPCAVVDVFGLGGAGSIELAELILANRVNQQFKPLYALNASVSEKLEELSKNVYCARKVLLSESAQQSCAWIEKHGFGNLPLCVAKTQYSLSDDPHAIGVPEGFDMHVNEVQLRAGAGFIVAKMGTISTMPGLPSNPNAMKIDVDERGHIFNIV